MGISRQDRIAAFAELGRALKTFGADDRSQQVIRQAVQANGWFMPREIMAAIDAIRTGMLRQNALEAWLEGYPDYTGKPRKVAVIAAGNIPLVCFYDLLCVLIAGHACLLKPSSRDRVLTGYVMELLHQIEPRFPLYEYREGDCPQAVIATGSDNTNRYFRSRYTDTAVLLRGSRSSVAMLDGRESPEQLNGLADDIFRYSGAGCRSVSLVWLPEGYDVSRLCRTLAQRYEPLNPKYLNNYRQQRALLSMSGTPFLDGDGFVMVEHAGMSPAQGRINYAFYRTAAQVRQWLEETDPHLQCVVSARAVHVRHAGFGQAQCPGLTDWPDGRDVLAFLYDAFREN